MSYLVLARRYRPQRFPELLGQDHVARTLSNAIKADRVAHAFLFAGPRGVGKTSAARILAKALNCRDGETPQPDPCGRCPACMEVNEGRSADVLEIDAASHTGVDNVREIIENVRYLPSSGRFKVYVIDEVHMLSTGAFNALLKTLEEPPAHAKFILATTDAHKVPVTILSRCQRYDFRRIASAQIAERLGQILDEEGIEFAADALTLVAREAEGSMRDAQSLLEQVLGALGGAALTPDAVRGALGVVDRRLVEAVFDAVLERAPSEALRAVHEVYQRGWDLRRFAEDVLQLIRDVLVVRVVSSPHEVVDRPSDELAAIEARAAQCEVRTLETMFDNLAKVIDESGRSPYLKYHLEVAFAALAEAPPRLALEPLLEQLERLEERLEAGPAAGPGAASGGGSSAAGGATTGRSGEGSGAQAVRGASAASVPARSAGRAPGPNVPNSDADSARVEENRAEVGAPADAVRSSSSSGSAAAEARREGARASDTPPRVSAGPAVEGASGEPKSFRGFVLGVRADRPALAASLSQVRPLSFSAAEVQLACETSFDHAKLSDRDVQDELLRRLRAYLGPKVVLKVVRGTSSAPESEPRPPTVAEEQAVERSERLRSKEQTARAQPGVRALGETLGAKISRVRVLDESN